jgi:hypothetical protein
MLKRNCNCSKLLGSANNTYVRSYWEDLRVAAAATKINPLTSKPDFASWIDGLLAFLFDPDDVESVHFAVQIPHSYKLGTDLKPHIHWSPTTANTGNVVWGLECTLANFGDVFPSTSKIYVADPGDGVANKHQIAVLPTIDGSGIDSTSSMLACRIFRDADGSEGSGLTDSYTADAVFHEFDFHVQLDSPGSIGEFLKEGP